MVHHAIFLLFWVASAAADKYHAILLLFEEASAAAHDDLCVMQSSLVFLLPPLLLTMRNVPSDLLLFPDGLSC